MSLTGLLLVGAIIILVLIAIGIAISSNSEKTLMEQRLGRYLGDDSKEAQKRKEETASVFADWVNKRVEKSSMGGNLSRDLARADLKLKAGEFIFIFIALAAGLGIAAFMFGGDVLPAKLISAAIGVGVGIAGPIIYMKTQQSKRLKKFNDQLPDMRIGASHAGFVVPDIVNDIIRIIDEYRPDGTDAE